MIETIEELRDIDDEIFITIKGSTQFINWFLKESPIPKTSELFWMYITSTNFIKNSIFDCAENEDIYSVKILFRSLIEHFLRFNYIFFKYTSVKNDSESYKYYLILDLSENLKYLKSIKSANSIFGEDEMRLDKLWDELCEKFPKYKTYNKKEIETWTKDYSIKNIIDFIQNKLPGGNDEFNPFLPSIILEYSDLSSFVHGGIFAYKNNMNFIENEKRQKELLRITNLALFTSSSIKKLSYLIFSQYKTEFADFYIKTDRLIKKLN